MFATDSSAPGSATGLVDRFGRVATDLRISLTDRCSLRCTYCMPAEGLVWLTKTERLSDDEIVRLAEVFVGPRVTSIRLTGGEPLVHPTLVPMVGAARGPRSASGAVADDERHQPDPVGRAAGRGRPGSHQRLTRHARPRAIPCAHPPRPARRRPRRGGRRGRGRHHPVEDQHRADARQQPGRGARTARVGAAGGLPVALHRAHAVGRRPHSGRATAWSPPTRSSNC